MSISSIDYSNPLMADAPEPSEDDLADIVTLERLLTVITRAIEVAETLPPISRMKTWCVEPADLIGDLETHRRDVAACIKRLETGSWAMLTASTPSRTTAELDAKDRAEEMIVAHQMATRFVRLALERAINDISKIAASPIGMPDDMTPHEYVVLLRRIMPPNYADDSKAAIELSARAHWLAMKEVQP